MWHVTCEFSFRYTCFYIFVLVGIIRIRRGIHCLLYVWLFFLWSLKFVFLLYCFHFSCWTWRFSLPFREEEEKKKISLPQQHKLSLVITKCLYPDILKITKSLFYRDFFFYLTFFWKQNIMVHTFGVIGGKNGQNPLSILSIHCANLVYKLQYPLYGLCLSVIPL